MNNARRFEIPLNFPLLKREVECMSRDERYGALRDDRRCSLRGIGMTAENGQIWGDKWSSIP